MSPPIGIIGRSDLSYQGGGSLLIQNVPAITGAEGLRTSNSEELKTNETVKRQ